MNDGTEVTFSLINGYLHSLRRIIKTLEDELREMTADRNAWQAVAGELRKTLDRHAANMSVDNCLAAKFNLPPEPVKKFKVIGTKYAKGKYRALRQYNKLTVREVADMAKVSASTVSMFERGASIRGNSAKAIKEVYDMMTKPTEENTGE